MTIYRYDGRRKSLKSLSMSQFAELFTGGSRVTSVTAAYSASVWAYSCIQLRAQTIANIPVQILDRATGDPLLEHPLTTVFSDVSSDLLARIEIALLVWGTCYLQITEARLGPLRGLNWLNPGAVSPLKDMRGIYAYQYTPNYGGFSQQFAPSQVAYLHTFNPSDDLDGLSPLQIALTDVGVDHNVSQFAESFFNNGARIEGILNVHGANDDQVDAIESKWKVRFRGVKNWFKTLIFGSQGMEYIPITYPMNDLALEVLSAETRRSICSAFRVPPILAGAWEASNYATSKEQRQSFYTETILPELDFIEDEVNRQFVWRFYPRVMLKFDTSEINALREDELTRNQALSTAVSGGWMTVNEARARVGLPAVEGGDILLPAPGTSPVAANGGGYEVAPYNDFFQRLDPALLGQIPNYP